MKNLQKTLLLALSMASTQAVESTSDAGTRMMKKQACVSSLSAFLTDSEKMRMQLLNKRVYKIREHIDYEAPIKIPGECFMLDFKDIQNKEGDIINEIAKGKTKHYEFQTTNDSKIIKLLEDSAWDNKTGTKVSWKITTHRPVGAVGPKNVEIILGNNACFLKDSLFQHKDNKPQLKNWTNADGPKRTLNMDGKGIMIIDNTIWTNGRLEEMYLHNINTNGKIINRTLDSVGRMQW